MLPICTFISQMSFRQNIPFSRNIYDWWNCCVQMVCVVTLNILANKSITAQLIMLKYAHCHMILFVLLIVNSNISPRKCVSFVNEKSFRKTEATIWNIQDDPSSKKLKRIYLMYVVNIKMKKNVGKSNNRQQKMNNLGFFI